MKHIHKISGFFALAALIGVVGFFNNKAEALSFQPPLPVITSITPAAGPIGSTVTIKGMGFTNIQYFAPGGTNNRIVFGTLGTENNPAYDLVPNAQGDLVFTVPESNYMSCWNPKTGPACSAPAMMTQPGEYDVSVINVNGQSKSIKFTVTSSLVTSTAPKIISLSSYSGVVGTTITLYGTGFSKTDNVIKFGNQNTQYNPAYKVSSTDSTSLTFVVPETNFIACQFATPKCYPKLLLTAPGVYDVSVTSNGIESNAVSFNVVDRVIENDYKDRIKLGYTKNSVSGSATNVDVIVGESITFSLSVPAEFMTASNSINGLKWNIPSLFSESDCVQVNNASIRCEVKNVGTGVFSATVAYNGKSYQSNSITVTSVKKVIDDCKTVPQDRFTVYLARGSRGVEVFTLQAFLRGYGFLPQSAKLDSKFGKATELAVMKFQKKYGLRQTGALNKATRAKMNEIEPKYCDTTDDSLATKI